MKKILLTRSEEKLDCGHPHDAGIPCSIVKDGKVEQIQGWTGVLRDGKMICHACDSKRVLDCGHHPSPHEAFTTGTAHTRDGREICWDCALIEESKALGGKKRCLAYVSSDGKRITTWPGRELMRVTGRRRAKLTRLSFTFDSRDYWTFWATDLHGARWTGRGSPGIYIKLRRQA